MNLATSKATDSPDLTVNRTKHPAGDDFAVQVFLADSYTQLYLTVAEARTLAARLLAATDTPAPEGIDR